MAKTDHAKQSFLLGPAEQKVYNAIIATPTITIGELAEKVKVSRTRIKHILDQLRLKDMIGHRVWEVM